MEGEEIEKTDIVKGGGGHENAHDVGDVVGPQRIRSECADDDQPRAGIGVEAEHMDARPAENEFEKQINQDGKDRREQRGDEPGRDDFGEHPQIRRGTGEEIPAHDRPDDRLRGRHRNSGARHPGDGQPCGECDGEGTRDGVDRTQVTQGLGDAGALHDGPEDHKEAGDGSGHLETHHA